MMKKKLFVIYILLYNFIGFTVAIGGWLWEVLLFLAKDHRFVNRGFLYGPWLPVYGTGAILLSAIFYYKDIHARVIYAYFGIQEYPQAFYHGFLYSKLQLSMQQTLQRMRRFPTKFVSSYNLQAYRNYNKGAKPLRHNKRKQQFTANIRIFLICMFGGGLVEYSVGWLIWHVFHRKYWNYAGYVLNINGYVCLFSAIGFGVFGLIWIKWAAPYLIRWWEGIRFSMQILVVGLLDVLLVTDAVFSLMKPNAGENITFSLWM